MRLKCPVSVAVLAVFVGGAMACGTVPQSQELQELEEQLRSSESQQLRELPNSARYHEEARQYRRVAEEAREDRRENRSREYARLGMIRYQTAVAIYEKFETADDLRDINAEIEEINPQVREVSQRRNELAEELRALDGEIREAVQEREQQRLADLQESDGSFESASDGDGAANAELVDEANDKIAEAEDLRDSALEHDADEYSETRGLFSRADTQLENAREMISDNPRSARTAVRQLGFAVQLFEEAHEQAIPIHEEYVERMQPDNRISAIRDMAQNNFGAQYTEDETGGVRVIMARLFVSGEEEFEHETGPLLDALANVSDEFGEFTIRIQGYTRQQGGTTENMALSQSRAHRVYEYLVDAGVDDGRIDHEGQGQQDIRYPDSPQNNDRVEVTLRHEER